MSEVQDSVLLRAEKAAQIISVDASKILEVLEDEGIENNANGLEILNSPTTTVEDLSDILMGGSSSMDEHNVIYHLGKIIKKLPAKTAAGILKNVNAQSNPINVTNVSNSLTSDITELAQALKPIKQWDDRSLLENYVLARSSEIEVELDDRAKHNKFIVLKDPINKNMKKYEPGTEEIDVETSLRLLKDARKRVVPGIIPLKGSDGFAVVYRITELNAQDRIIEVCPFCDEILWEGYCERCQTNFTEVGKDELAYIRLITEFCKDRKDIIGSSDRKAIWVSALKGLEDLYKTWPGVIERFQELKATDSLPKLKKSKQLPSVKPADPFGVSGNRTY
jgi:hypothetical protein